MKSKCGKSDAGFTPTTVYITCESQAELDALTTLFNHAYIGKVTKELFDVNLSENLYRTFLDAGGKNTKHVEFGRQIHDAFARVY